MPPMRASQAKTGGGAKLEMTLGARAIGADLGEWSRFVAAATQGFVHVRDVLTAQVPMILRADIYASAAVLGILVYRLLRATPLPTAPAFVLAAVVIAGCRLMAVAYGWQLPVLAPTR